MSVEDTQILERSRQVRANIKEEEMVRVTPCLSQQTGTVRGEGWVRGPVLLWREASWWLLCLHELRWL